MMSAKEERRGKRVWSDVDPQQPPEQWARYVSPVPSVAAHNKDEQNNLFAEINRLKRGAEGKRQLLEEEKERAKYSNGCLGRIVKNKKFEAATITVIMMNALAIGYDTDYTARWGKPDKLYDGPISFIIVENFFAAYFTAEILIRFLAFRHKTTMFKDAWFIFDATLVAFMIIETWILASLSNGSPLGDLSILRLLRLLRITRMAKLMRAVPELMMIVKGITAAARAVIWAAVLLIIVTYTWAILFTNEYHQGLLADDDIDDGAVEQLFGSMGKSFMSLLVMGTILDDVTLCTDVIRSTSKLTMLCAFIVYILINSFTLMNMLVGVLVEMVGSTATGEQKSRAAAGFRECVEHMFSALDEDGSGKISRREYEHALKEKKLMKNLSELGITPRHMRMYGQILFDEPNALVDSDTMIDLIIRLQPSEEISVLDFSDFGRLMEGCANSVSTRVCRVEKLCDALTSRLRLDVSETSSVDDPTSSRVAPEPSMPSAAELTKALANTGSTSCTLQRQALREEDGTEKKINLHMLAQLELTTCTEIISELQRRVGVDRVEEIGIPLSLLDDELRDRVCAHNEFLALDYPHHPNPDWSGETFSA